MTVKGQLQHEPSSYTAIESLAPEWIKHWMGPVNHTDIIPSQPIQTFFAEVIRAFERSFNRQQDVEVLRLTYCSAADRLADLDPSQLPFPRQTPIEAAERLAPKLEDDALPPSALINHLLEWLRVTYDELAEMTGISRSALFYWRKTGATPRAGNIRQVLRLYSLASVLVRRFGKDGARRWLHSDGQGAWQCLKRGDIDQAEELVRSKLFGQKSHPSRGSRALSEEVDFSSGIGANAPIKRATRRPKRGRPGSS
jgi:hypothetical protein